MRPPRKRIVAAWIAIGIVSLFPTAGHAEFSLGGGFTAPGYGVRAWGMGGAAVASGADEGAAYWNPAMLAMVDKHIVGLAYSNLIPGTESGQSYLAYAQPLQRGPADEPGLEFAIHAVGAVYGNLRLELSDGQSYTENTLRLSYAYTPFYFVSFGVSFTGLLSTSDIDGFGAQGTSLDIGLRLALAKAFTFGLAGRNVLSQLSFEDGVDVRLTRALTFALAYEPMANLVIEGDAVAHSGGLTKLVLGSEYVVYRDVLAVRGGIASFMAGESRAVAYLGAGVQVRGFRFDYSASFDNEEAFEKTHRLSLGIGF